MAIDSLSCHKFVWNVSTEKNWFKEMICASSQMFQKFVWQSFLFPVMLLCFLFFHSLAVLFFYVPIVSLCSNISIKFTQHSCWFHRGKEIIMEITTCSGWFGMKNVFPAAYAAGDIRFYPVIRGRTFRNKWIQGFWKGLWWDLDILCTLKICQRKKMKHLWASLVAFTSKISHFVFYSTAKLSSCWL